MFTLIRGGDLYGPQPMGVKDILVVGRTIARIADEIQLPEEFGVTMIRAAGKVVVPGFIDGHVHLLGGGGEGGPRTRTPEITLSRIVRAGVTTVVGCLGTDDVSRRPETLLAKAMQLDEEGISTYVYCVDNQNHVLVPDNYQANIVPLKNWNATEQGQVRKGTNTAWNDLDGLLDGSYNTMTAQQRYQAATYLVALYSAFPVTGPALATQNDKDLQNAAWYLLFQGTTGANAMSAASQAYAKQALDMVLASPTFGFLNWAVISGVVDRNGNVLDFGKQTFLVQLSDTPDEPTPEPGTYLMLGGGLAGLAVLRRRRAK